MTYEVRVQRNDIIENMRKNNDIQRAFGAECNRYKLNAVMSERLSVVENRADKMSDEMTQDMNALTATLNEALLALQTKNNVSLQLEEANIAFETKRTQATFNSLHQAAVAMITADQELSEAVMNANLAMESALNKYE